MKTSNNPLNGTAYRRPLVETAGGNRVTMKFSPRNLLYRIFGAMGATGFGLTIAAALMWFNFESFWHVRDWIFWLVSFLAAPVGWHLGALCSEEPATDGTEPPKFRASFALVNLYLFLSVIAFLDAFRSLDPTLRIDRGTVHLDVVILGYGFLRLWIFVSRLWRHYFEEEPLFFIGLYLGTLPNLLWVLERSRPFGLPWGMLSIFRRILDFPGSCINRSFFSTMYINWFHDISTHTLANCLTWTFVFLIAGIVVRRFRADAIRRA